MPPPATAKPAWLRYAVPVAATGNRPLVAIVLDDLGLDRMRTAEALRLSGPLTLSFMTYATDLAAQTQAARHAGHELLLHVPMEAVDQHADPGPTASSPGCRVKRLCSDYAGGSAASMVLSESTTIWAANLQPNEL